MYNVDDDLFVFLCFVGPQQRIFFHDWFSSGLCTSDSLSPLLMEFNSVISHCSSPVLLVLFDELSLLGALGHCPVTLLSLVRATLPLSSWCVGWHENEANNDSTELLSSRADVKLTVRPLASGYTPQVDAKLTVELLRPDRGLYVHGEYLLRCGERKLECSPTYNFT